MPKITIYNDSEANLDADFEVIELLDGKEANRRMMEPSDHCQCFRLYASNQAFLIVPRGTGAIKITGMGKGRQIDAKTREGV